MKNQNTHCQKTSVGTSKPFKLNQWKKSHLFMLLEAAKVKQTPCR